MTAKLGRADWRGVRPVDLVLLASGNWNWTNVLIENGCFEFEFRSPTPKCFGQWSETQICVDSKLPGPSPQTTSNRCGASIFRRAGHVVSYLVELIGAERVSVRSCK